MSEEYTGPEIVDAIQDQYDRRWIFVRGLHSKHPICFAVDELADSGTALFRRLSYGGIDILTNSEKERFRKTTASHQDYRRGVSAKGPGWIGDVFVSGDGVVHSTMTSNHVIVGFPVDHRFASHGSLEAAVTALTPLVKGQSLLQFLFCYSLVPVLLRFAPPGVGNPIVELVGGTGTGKTTAGVFAMATWAGDPESNVGGGATWNRTLMSLDAEKVRHNGMMLLLDETNLIPEERRAKDLKDALFSLEATGSRARMNDPLPVQNSRLATLSSSNVPLADILKCKVEDKKAAASRLLTILLGTTRPHGIFDRIPDGFASAEAAAVALRASSNANYAVFGPAFAEALSARDPTKMQRTFDTLYERALAEVGSFEELSPRQQKTLALTIVAGQLAVRFCVVPPDLGSVVEAVQSVRGMIAVEGDMGRAARQSIQHYVDAHACDLRRVEDLKAPLSKLEVSQSPGFMHRIDGESYLLIDTGMFTRIFADQARDVLRSLKAANRLRTEGEKNVIKPPRALSDEGRIYCIRLERDLPRRARIVLPKGHVPYAHRRTAHVISKIE